MLKLINANLLMLRAIVRLQTTPITLDKQQFHRNWKAIDLIAWSVAIPSLKPTWHKQKCVIPFLDAPKQSSRASFKVSLPKLRCMKTSHGKHLWGKEVSLNKGPPLRIQKYIWLSIQISIISTRLFEKSRFETFTCAKKTSKHQSFETVKFMSYPTIHVIPPRQPVTFWTLYGGMSQQLG